LSLTELGELADRDFVDELGLDSEGERAGVVEVVAPVVDETEVVLVVDGFGVAVEDVHLQGVLDGDEEAGGDVVAVVPGIRLWFEPDFVLVIVGVAAVKSVYHGDLGVGGAGGEEGGPGEGVVV